jgi:heptosyltransferase-2
MTNNTRNSVRNILVRAPNWIGDQVLAYPFFYFLRRAYPQARIASACVPWVSDLQFQDLINETHVLSRPLVPGTWAKFEAMEKSAADLKAKGPWDLFFSLPNSFSSAWIGYRSGARERVGYTGDGRGLLLTEKRAERKALDAHRAEAYVELLPEWARPRLPVQEFWGVPAENELDQPVPGVLPRFDADRAWPQTTDASRVEAPDFGYYVLAPGSTAESRRWPVEFFAELAETIAEKTGLKGLIIGGASEALLADRLTARPELKLVDYTARGPVPVYARVFAKARFTIANDSGLAHVASLCGSPVHVVWGAGNPKRTRPMGPGEVKISLNPVDCWPCERNSCSQPPERKLQCLLGTRPEAVWEELKREIDRNSGTR